MPINIDAGLGWSSPMSVSLRLRRIFRYTPSASFLVWFLAMVLIPPGYSSLMASNATPYVAQIPGSFVLFSPLIAHRWSPLPPILISEVLYDPADFEPAAEWIELYNYGGEEVDLSGFMIGDAHEAGSHEGMFIFPTEAKISPEEIVIITPDALGFEVTYGFKPDFEFYKTDPAVPDMIKNNDWAEGGVSLSNQGDEVILLFLSGALVDIVSWGDSTTAFSPSVPPVAEAHSIERYPAYFDTNTNADWRDQSNPSPGQIDRTPLPTHTPLPATATTTPTLTQVPLPTRTNTPTPTQAQLPGEHLLISEVFYYPTTMEPQNEWIEVYNPTQQDISLDEYKLGDEETSGGIEGMFRFPSGAIIPAGERIVVAHDASSFQDNYPMLPDFELEDTDPAVPDMLVYSIWAGGDLVMGNEGDEILLLGDGDILVDALSWGTSKWAFNPPCGVVTQGSSLERYPDDVDTNSADDWREQEVPNPGSYSN